METYRPGVGAMTTKYYSDAQGNYIGGYDGAEPPAGAIERPSPPDHGFDLWDGAQWSPNMPRMRDEVVFPKLREVRHPVILALSEIAGRKHRGNKKDIADAIDTAVQGLLDMEHDQGVLAATNMADLEIALEAIYAQVVTTLATTLGADWLEVQTAFREYEL